MRPVSVTFAAFAACVLSAGSAFAHAHLQAEVPAANAVVAQSPAALSLTFSEGLEAALSGASLKGPDGTPAPTGIAALDPADDKVMIVPISGHLAAGRYVVEWHALSKDGHATHGTYRFDVVP